MTPPSPNSQNARIELSMGPEPMPYYWTNRTLETAETPLWDFTAQQPNLVVISLGGNDYNHQKGNTPSNQTFNAAYSLVCGVGYPSHGIC